MWRYCAAAVPGTKHRRVDAPCQDAIDCAFTDGGAFVAAVADGAGSAVAAEEGARLAAAAAVDHLCDRLRPAAQFRRELAAAPPGHGRPATSEADEGVDLIACVRSAFSAARAEVLAAARASGRAPRDLATTLLVVVVDGERGAAGQIGDGVIARRTEKAGWSWVFWPQHGEYANTTRFLVERDAEVHLQLCRLEADVTDLALMSDGLEALALDFGEQRAHAPFFDGMIRPLLFEAEDGERLALARRLAAELEKPVFAERTDDDLSLVLATRRPRPERPGPVTSPGLAEAPAPETPTSILTRWPRRGRGPGWRHKRLASATGAGEGGAYRRRPSARSRR